MDIVGKHLEFVNQQVVTQERFIKKFANTAWRKDLHQKSADQFKQLADDLVLAQSMINDGNSAPLKSINVHKQVSLNADDIEGLPEELMKELNISESDKLEFVIISLITEAGGILSLDKILVGLYKRTKEVHKRTALTSRLYRMSQKTLIYNVPNRKGLYSLSELTPEDVKRLFGQEEPETVDNA